MLQTRRKGSVSAYSFFHILKQAGVFVNTGLLFLLGILIRGG
jgi:hypothetical protein